MLVASEHPFVPSVAPTHSTSGTACYGRCASKTLEWNAEALRAASNCSSIPAELLPESYTLVIRGETSNKALELLLWLLPELRHAYSTRWSKETLKLGVEIFWKEFRQTPEQRQLEELRAEVAVLRHRIGTAAEKGQEVAADMKAAPKKDLRGRYQKAE